jgi:hypothetical protein
MEGISYPRKVKKAFPKAPNEEHFVDYLFEDIGFWLS